MMDVTKTNEQTGVLAIRLLNFMAFEDTDWIELKPITLLFGRNSSGKSAIIRALRLLKQSLQADSKSGPFLFRSRTGLDQGTFKNTVHMMNEEDECYIVFSFRCGLAGKQSEYEVEWLKQEINDLRKKQKLESVPYDLTPEWPNWLDVHIGFADIGANATKSNQEKVIPALLRIESPWRLVKGQTHPTIVFAIEKLEESPAEALGFGWHFWSDVIRRGKDPWPDFQIVQDESGFWPMQIEEIESMSDGKRVNNILAAFREEIEVFLKNIEYLGPLRPEPRRIYALSKLDADEWRQYGLGGMIDYLSGKEPEKYKTVNNWIQNLCFGESINEPNRDVPKELEVLTSIEINEKKKASETPLTINLADMGSGVAQVLPVILLSLSAKEESLVIIEQPELHLHPSGQATLTDLLIQNSHLGARFFIETHSEHILLRLQRRIAESTIDNLLVKDDQKNSNASKPRNDGYEVQKERFSLVFVYRASGQSNIEFIVANKRGELQDTSPSFLDFFRDDYDDVVSRNKAIADIIQMEHRNENRD